MFNRFYNSNSIFKNILDTLNNILPDLTSISDLLIFQSQDTEISPALLVINDSITGLYPKFDKQHETLTLINNQIIDTIIPGINNLYNTEELNHLELEEKR
jgi:hypothetical protein